MKTMICKHCGKECERTSNAQKYCPECRMKIQMQLNAAYLKKKSQGQSLEKEGVCAICGKAFTKNAPNQIYCSDCIESHRVIANRYAKMTVGEKNSKAKRSNELYDRVVSYVPKGKKQELQALAAEHEMSLNQFVNLAIQQLEEELRKEPANNSTQE